LLTLIQKGNQSAFCAGTQMAKGMGVGELEDFYRSTGGFLDVLEACRGECDSRSQTGLHVDHAPA
jgi:hypothetical protein